MGMPALPYVHARTTLVKFLKVDVYCGLFIFIDLHPYKTLFYFCMPLCCLLLVVDNANDDGDNFVSLEYKGSYSLFCSDAIFFSLLVGYFFFFSFFLFFE